MTWLADVERRLGARPVRRLQPADGLRRAAVLVPLFVAEGQLWVLLTRRAAGLASHAGQIAFPGGGCEAVDTDEVDTALRETQEELGVARDQIVVLGALDDTPTGSGFAVAPVVGALPYPFQAAPARSEVEALLPLPLSFLLAPTLVEEELVETPVGALRSPVYHYGGQRVFGATARILADLLERLSG